MEPYERICFNFPPEYPVHPVAGEPAEVLAACCRAFIYNLIRNQA